MRQEMMGLCDGSGVSWTVRKQSAPRSRQITKQHLIIQFFTGRMLFLTPNEKCQSTEDRICDYAAPQRLDYTVTQTMFKIVQKQGIV